MWLSFFLAVKQLYRPIWLESTSLLAECHQIMFKAEVFLGSFFQKKCTNLAYEFLKREMSCEISGGTRSATLNELGL